MDTFTAVPPRHDPLDLAQFARVVEEAHGKVYEAARAWGVHSDEPFSHFLTALLVTQQRFGEGTIEAVAELKRIMANAQLAAEGDVLRRRQIQKETAEMNAELRRSVTAVVDAAQEERRSLHDNFLDQMVPKLSKSLEKCLVIRERRHNRFSLVSQVLMVMGAVTAVFLAGFVASLWTDWRGSARLDELQVAIARCIVRETVADASGNRHCSLASLLPQHEVPLPAAGSKPSSR